MTITRVGSNSRYAEGWERAFGTRKKSAAKAKKEPAPAAKPSAKKKKTAKKA